MLYFKHACKQLKQRPLFALALFGIALALTALGLLALLFVPNAYVAEFLSDAFVALIYLVPIALAAGSPPARIVRILPAALMAFVPFAIEQLFIIIWQALEPSGNHVPAIAGFLLVFTFVIAIVQLYIGRLCIPLYYALCAQNEPRPFRRACSLSAHPLLLIRAFFTTLWPLLLATLVFNQIFLLIPATKALSGYLTTALTMPLSAFMMLDYANAASKLQPPPQPIQESNEGGTSHV